MASDPAKEATLEDIRALLVAQGRELEAVRQEMANMEGQSLAVPWPLAAQRLGCGKTKIFELLKAGKLTPAHRLGRNTMITTESINAILLGHCQRRPDQAPTSRRSQPLSPRSINSVDSSNYVKRLDAVLRLSI